MKLGFRKPSIKKRISARTSIKRQVIHKQVLRCLGEKAGLEILGNICITKFTIKPALIYSRSLKNCLGEKIYSS